MKIVNAIIVIVCLAGIGFVGFYFFGGFVKPKSSVQATEAPAVITEPTIEDKQRAAINDYFERQSRGLSGDGMFCSGSNPISFFAVRKWEILTAVEAFKTFGDYIVRVDSSNKGGAQVTTDFKIGVRTKDFPNAEKDYCISSVYAK